MSGLPRAGAFARLLVPILLLITCGLAHANCIEGPNQAIRNLQTLAVSDSNEALARVQVMLEGSATAKASPEDIAWPIVFLCTEWARHINGEILNVNGGSVLCG